MSFAACGRDAGLKAPTGELAALLTGAPSPDSSELPRVGPCAVHRNRGSAPCSGRPRVRPDRGSARRGRRQPPRARAVSRFSANPPERRAAIRRRAGSSYPQGVADGDSREWAEHGLRRRPLGRERAAFLEQHQDALHTQREPHGRRVPSAEHPHESVVVGRPPQANPRLPLPPPRKWAPCSSSGRGRGSVRIGPERLLPGLRRVHRAAR